MSSIHTSSCTQSMYTVSCTEYHVHSSPVSLTTIVTYWYLHKLIKGWTKYLSTTHDKFRMRKIGQGKRRAGGNIEEHNLEVLNYCTLEKI